MTANLARAKAVPCPWNLLKQHVDNVHDQLIKPVLGCEGGGQERGAINRTIGGRDADAERTGTYLQRVLLIAPLS